MKTAAIMFLGFSTGILALVELKSQLPEHPPWIVGACAESPCVLPVELFPRLDVGGSWYEEGTTNPCPAPALNQLSKGACVSANPYLVNWITFTREDGSKVVAAANSTFYGPPGADPLNLGVPGDGVWPLAALDGVFMYSAVPSEAQPPQVPDVPPGDKDAWDDYLDRWCAQSGNPCSAGSIDHVHDFTINGETVTTSSGR